MGRRWRAKRWLVTLLAGSLCIACLGLSSGDGQPERSPPNHGFLAYLEQILGGKRPLQQAEADVWLGRVPSPIDLSHTVGRSPEGFPQRGVPASYDLRGTGRLSPVRSQGSCGSCWAFATYGAHESWKRTEVPADAQDLSENHLKECHGFDWGPCAGGNRAISTAYLARGDGTVLEAEDPYIDGDDPSGCSASILACPPPEGPPAHGSVAQPVVYEYIHNAHWISDVDKATDPDPDYLKQAIIDYGAVMTTMEWDSDYYDDNTDAYYYDGAEDGNHCVNLVGWDDSFDRNLFKTTPPGDGAWIVRNSWGTGFGDSGYFYISYHDTVIATENTVFIDQQDPEGLWIYEHDPFGWTGSSWRWVDDNVDWAANVFTAETSGRLLAVGFYTNDVGTAYEIDVREGSPWGASLLASNPSGTCSWPGYHVVDLPSPPSVSMGDVFAIVVKYTNPSNEWVIPEEDNYAGYTSAATSSAGQSYFSYNGSHDAGDWVDLAAYDSDANFCIKGIFTDEPSSAVFRVTREGRVRADGTVYAQAFQSDSSADVAEWVEISEAVEPGDVLELDPTRPGQYRKARGPCSPYIAGVVSTEPGVILGALTPGHRALLALVGIVPVKACDEGGPIEPGDLLVTASRAGYVRRYQSGECTYIVGKAMEPLYGAEGLILVLLTR